MRLRNVKGAKDKILASKYNIVNPFDNINNWNKVFNNNNPIYIEIGMGKGKFIIENAINNPNINYIGIEKFDSVIVRAIEKVEQLDIPNLKFIRMDATRIDEVFNKEIDRIYLNFSDPWPKDRHSKRRLTSPIFLEKYDKVFKKDNIIEMKTDNIDLFNYSIYSLKAHGYNIEYITNDLHRENVDIIMTEYEERFSLLNNKINKLIARK